MWVEAVPGRLLTASGADRLGEPATSAPLSPAAGIHGPRGCPGPGAARYAGGAKTPGWDRPGARWPTLTAVPKPPVPRGSRREPTLTGQRCYRTGAAGSPEWRWGGGHRGGNYCKHIKTGTVVELLLSRWDGRAHLLLSSAAPFCPGSPKRSRKPKRHRSLVRRRPMKRRWRRPQRWPGWS